MLARCMIMNAQFLSIEPKPARGNFPPSCLVKVLDLDVDKTVELYAAEDVGREFAQVKRGTNLPLALSWRLVQGERGETYRLRLLGIAKAAAPAAG